MEEQGIRQRCKGALEGNRTALYFIEMHTPDKTVVIGRAPNVPSDMAVKAHFVLADVNDDSKYIEFVVNVTFE